MPRPKFRVGDTVCYKADRRTRRKITDRYFDKAYPAWRYRFDEAGLSKQLADVWAVVEDQLLLVRRRST
jgi:hypothetical protein